MARLRFPGRPGYRFDRLGIRYGVDQPKRGLDPTTELIANIHRGLQYFHELFGESDEVKANPFRSFPYFRPWLKFLKFKLLNPNRVISSLIGVAGR